MSASKKPVEPPLDWAEAIASVVACEGAMEAYGGVLAGFGGFLEGIEAPEAIPFAVGCDEGSPALGMVAEADALNAGRIIVVSAAIGRVLSAGCGAQIVDAVVGSIPVDVVDLGWYWLAAHQQPREAVCVEQAALTEQSQSDGDVAVRGQEPCLGAWAPCVVDVADPGGGEVFGWPMAPAEYASGRVVVEALAHSGGVWQCPESHLIHPVQGLWSGAGGVGSAVVPVPA